MEKIKEFISWVLGMIFILSVIALPTYLIVCGANYQYYNMFTFTVPDSIKEKVDTIKPLPNLNNIEEDNRPAVSTIPIGVPIGGGLYINP